MNTDQTILSFDKVSFRYEPTAPPVLKDVSFSLPKGSFYSVVGPSGGGKSTILRLAAGLVKPASGTLINDSRTRMVFQDAALLPWLTVEENVELGFTGVDCHRREIPKKTHAILMELGIKEFAKAYPRDLSGGQRQRVGIARALVSAPELLLLDEPFAALDVETAERLASELLALKDKYGITMLMVSHSIEDAVALSDKVLVCAEGTVAHQIPVTLPRPRVRTDEKVHTLMREVHGFIPSFKI